MSLSDAQLGTAAAVSDITRAALFYEGKLGLVELPDPTPDEVRAYECGDGSTLMIYVSEHAGSSEATIGNFVVDDVEETVDELTEAGVEFERYPGMEQDEKGIGPTPGEGHIAWFRDPDGNTFALMGH